LPWATHLGRKHLISGNNDDVAVTGSAGWETVQPYCEVSVDGRGGANHSSARRS
jgi:calcineurin-like phosphoesterase family protein